MNSSRRRLLPKAWGTIIERAVRHARGGQELCAEMMKRFERLVGPDHRFAERRDPEAPAARLRAVDFVLLGSRYGRTLLPATPTPTTIQRLDL